MMKDADKFKGWYKERCGHPLGVNLGMKAVIELEKENAELREFLGALQLDVSNEIKLEQLLKKHGEQWIST